MCELTHVCVEFILCRFVRLSKFRLRDSVCYSSSRNYILENLRDPFLLARAAEYAGRFICDLRIHLYVETVGKEREVKEKERFAER